jgi:hypothetical protein
MGIRTFFLCFFFIVIILAKIKYSGKYNKSYISTGRQALSGAPAAPHGRRAPHTGAWRPTRIKTKKINTRKKTISAKRCHREKITLEIFMCMLLYIYNSACFFIIPPKTQVDISSSILWAGKIHVYVKCKNHSQTINLQRTSL